MTQAAQLNPTDAELEVLKCFWRDGDLSSREVHDRVAAQQDWTPSTTRTVLERMRAKGLLSRRNVHGVAVYSQTRPKVEVLTGLMRRFSALLDMDKALPATAFTGSQWLDDADIAELETLLNAPMAETGSEDDGQH
ncbi:BlaI/MecI/CopY family transcriptional regulator [Brevundimonas goettingensis]|uniref:BlaI/MecI/CopY family transcriptional regulator n=1 Tax=Brevundimonas goettingensis TaxID=2774190 RepID=A0A975C403_9CAUL|nr:BlaI/MecI/CopY family transcriptional regulator [Brevundimonas goettingensis]QTC92669.1 BlaI/MecI/CopY family transcriptional regulator [Brevundimonas goettingensis]